MQIPNDLGYIVDLLQYHTARDKSLGRPGYEASYNIAQTLLSSKGLGSAILEHLREDYPLSYILSVPVAPFSLGETPLQHYNTVLCLSWLQDYCDAVLMFQNDCVLQQTQKYLSKGAPGRRGSESVSLEDMNRHISHTLCNSLLPVWSAKPHRLVYTEPGPRLRL